MPADEITEPLVVSLIVYLDVSDQADINLLFAPDYSLGSRTFYEVASDRYEISEDSQSRYRIDFETTVTDAFFTSWITARISGPFML